MIRMHHLLPTLNIYTVRNILHRRNYSTAINVHRAIIFTITKS